MGSIHSCNGQHQPPAKVNSLNTGLDNNKKWIDPLFFIDGQLCQHLRKISQDSKGNLWFGTNVYGLMKYDGDSLIYLSDLPGIERSRVTGIMEDSRNHLWIGHSSGITRYNGNTFKTFTEKDGLVFDEVWCIYIDSDDLLWIGTSMGLSTYDGINFKTVEIPKPSISEPEIIYSENRITSITQDNTGNIWLGLDGFGLARYDGNAFTFFSEADGLCDNTISELLVDSKNNLWIGTYFGGVCTYDGENFNQYDENDRVYGVEAGAFYEDVNGDIWFAIENNGVYKYDGDSFTQYDEKNNLETNGILSIYRDTNNRLWMGGWGGLFRLDHEAFSPVGKDGPWDITISHE